MKRFAKLALLAALVLGLCVTPLEPARRMDAWSSDLWHVVAGKRYEPSHVAVVLLDDEALDEEQSGEAGGGEKEVDYAKL